MTQKSLETSRFQGLSYIFSYGGKAPSARIVFNVIQSVIQIQPFSDIRTTDISILYDVAGLQFPEEVELLAGHPGARQCFLFSFLLDMDD